MIPPIEWTIPIGIVLHFVALVAVIIGAYWRLRELIFRLHAEKAAKIAENSAKIAEVAVMLKPIWEWWNKRIGNNRGL